MCKHVKISLLIKIITNFKHILNHLSNILVFKQRDRERDRRDIRDDRAGEKWLTDSPTNTIILRGLPDCIEEKDVRLQCSFTGLSVM